MFKLFLERGKGNDNDEATANDCCRCLERRDLERGQSSA